MAMMSTSSEHRLDGVWAYFLELYGRPGVKETCLDWQDRLGADVILLLWLLWLGAERGLMVDVAGLRRVDERMAEWRNSAVLPIRAARRILGERAKTGDGEAAGLYSRLKRVELAAERTALRRLLREGEVAAQQSSPALAATGNLERYLGAFDGFMPQDGIGIAMLVNAAEKVMEQGGRPAGSCRRIP